MIICNLKPSRLNFTFSKNRRKQKNQSEILYVHNRSGKPPEKILERYARRSIILSSRYNRVKFISIGRFTDYNDWSSEWIEEGFYVFPKL